MLRIKPRTAGWEAETLPLCYAAPAQYSIFSKLGFSQPGNFQLTHHCQLTYSQLAYLLSIHLRIVNSSTVNSSIGFRVREAFLEWWRSVSPNLFIIKKDKAAIFSWIMVVIFFSWKTSRHENNEVWEDFYQNFQPLENLNILSQRWNELFWTWVELLR